VFDIRYSAVRPFPRYSAVRFFPQVRFSPEVLR